MNFWTQEACPQLSPTFTEDAPIIDSNFIYEISDGHDLYGLSLDDGHRALLSSLQLYTKDPTPCGQFLVHGKRIYYVTMSEIVCAERK